MGINTIHRNPKDLVSAYNETKNSWFKCELVDDVKSEKIRVSLGLDLPSVTLTLRVNGHIEVNDKDRIRVLNKRLLVKKILSNFSNNMQFRKRADYEFFNGTTYLFLE